MEVSQSIEGRSASCAELRTVVKDGDRTKEQRSCQLVYICVNG